MRKVIITMLVVAGLFLAWPSANVMAFQIITKDMMDQETVTKVDLIRTVDNFIILFDSSGSSGKMVPGKDVTRIAATKAMLKERNAWLPDLGYQAGLYVYTDNATMAGTFKEIYGMQPYDREAFAAAIDQLPDTGQGPTMLQPGLSGLRNTLKGLSGKTAIIMFTDGTFTVNRGPKRPLQIAQEIAKDHDVCFYLISSAEQSAQEQLLEATAKINACSRVIDLENFLDNPSYSSGILYDTKATSYTRMKPVTQVVGVDVGDVLFDFDSSVLRSQYDDNLDKLAGFLKDHPDAYVVAGGYADSSGDEEYNLALSEKRAASVKNYLVNSGVNEDQIVALWFGELNPVGDNMTEAGRESNRRVEIAVGGVK
jgi:OOP family OmpA-OmpF porin